MGDIGRPIRHIEIEPISLTSPIPEPSPAPVREPEEVPA